MEAASRQGGGDCPVILSLQNISTETQAQSRLAVLRQELCQSLGTVGASQGHWAYGPSAFTVFGGTAGKPGGRMPAPSFPMARTARFTLLASITCDRLDTRVNAKQEGSP